MVKLFQRIHWVLTPAWSSSQPGTKHLGKQLPIHGFVIKADKASSRLQGITIGRIWPLFSKPQSHPVHEAIHFKGFFPAGARACHRGSVILELCCFTVLLAPTMTLLLFSWLDPPWSDGIHFPFPCFVVLTCQSPVLNAEHQDSKNFSDVGDRPTVPKTTAAPISSACHCYLLYNTLILHSSNINASI